MLRLPHSKTQLIGHTEQVVSVSFSQMATRSQVGVIKKWFYGMLRLPHSETLSDTPNGSGMYRSVQMARTLASENYREVHLWNVATATLRNTLRHTSGVGSIAFSPDGSTLASGVSMGVSEKCIYGMLRLPRSEILSDTPAAAALILMYRSVRMVEPSQVVMWTGRCIYGMLRLPHSEILSGTSVGSIVSRSVRMAPCSQVGVLTARCCCGNSHQHLILHHQSLTSRIRTSAPRLPKQSVRHQRIPLPVRTWKRWGNLGQPAEHYRSARH